MVVRFASIFFACTTFVCAAGDSINGHDILLGPDGKLLSWVQPQEKAYDRVARLAWDFLLDRLPVEANGLKPFYTYCCIDEKTLRGTAWPHNPAGVNAMLADSAAAWYAYSGDRRVVDLVKGLLDHQIANGTTPGGWLWGGVPYASSDHGSVKYRGAYEFAYDKKLIGRGDGYGVIEPDKAGELGYGYLQFWKLTGETRYRDAALACANALAKNVRTGSAGQSPWPFRVYAETGVVREDYSGNTFGALKLFDEVIRLGLGDITAYRKARATAWEWTLRYPMANNVWANYFEDIAHRDSTDNLNQYSPLELARYLLDRPDLDPAWREHAAGLIGFVERHFGADTRQERGVVYGATTISEQDDYDFKMVSHTGRFASVLARWAEVTGDRDAREKAFRSLNWTTYMCDERGLVKVGPKEHSIWFTDGYGDNIRHLMAAMGAQPEWAPPGENHLLRSTSVVKQVEYGDGRVSYQTFDGDGEEVLRLAFAPAKVEAGGHALARQQDGSPAGWNFDSSTMVLRLKRTGARQVRITR